MSTLSIARPKQHAFQFAAAVLFWALAALAVMSCPVLVAGLPASVCAAAKVVVIVAASWAYVHVAAPRGTMDHALLVGLLWLLLDIGAEIVATAAVGRPWYTLVGAPEHAAVRTALMLAWLASPSLFVRHRGDEPVRP